MLGMRQEKSWFECYIQRNICSTTMGIDPFYANRIKQSQIIHSIAYFDRRVTCIQWHPHPQYPTTLVVASKSGDIVWWDHTKQELHSEYEKSLENDQVGYIYGQGAGGSITQMKFDPTFAHFIYTSSVDGTVRKQDFEGRGSAVFQDTLNEDKWFTSLDIGHPHTFGSAILISGSNWGQVTFMTLDGVLSWTGKLHKGKVHDIEFHPLHSHLFVTSGGDKTCRLWDIRMLAGDAFKKPLVEIPHEGIVTAGTFSKLAPFDLLTTAQNSECHVYDSMDPHMPLKAKIAHPHRHFQHLTSIRGDWHTTLKGVFAIGRYPERAEAQDRRTVDLYKVSSGSIEPFAKAEDVRVSGIHCLNKFNNAGDLMATCSGMSTYLWSLSQLPPDDDPKGKGKKKPKHFQIPDQDGHDGGDSSDDEDDQGQGPSRRRPFTVMRSSGKNAPSKKVKSK